MRHLFCASLLLAGPALGAELLITQIDVRDNSFETTNVIDNPEQLSRAEIEWAALLPIDSLPNYNWTHRLKITSTSIGGLWLYNKEGYVAKLNKLMSPMYRVSDTARFNEILLGL